MKGVKVPLMVISSIILFSIYNLDIIAQLKQLFMGFDYKPSAGGIILTSVFLAGGSSSVNKVLEIWKIRTLDERVLKVTGETTSKDSKEEQQNSLVKETLVLLKSNLKSINKFETDQSKVTKNKTLLSGIDDYQN